MAEDKLILSCQIPYGKKAIIRKLKGPEQYTERLRELGFNEGVEISKLNNNTDTCIILNINGAKIYLNEGAAHIILVEVL